MDCWMYTNGVSYNININRSLCWDISDLQGRITFKLNIEISELHGSVYILFRASTCSATSESAVGPYRT